MEIRADQDENGKITVYENIGDIDTEIGVAIDKAQAQLMIENRIKEIRMTTILRWSAKNVDKNGKPDIKDLTV